MSIYKKPNHYPEADIVATKSGWAYTKNHNEILTAIANLDTKIENETPTPDPEPEIQVEDITLDTYEVTLKVGEHRDFVATITPSNATNKTLLWSTNDEAIAAVEDKKVTGVSEGTTTVTVTSVSGGKSKTVTVTVTAAE